jgi:hypothetical protein
MPDWIAHLMFGTIISFILGINKEKRIVFLIGNLMPDFLRFLYILNNFFDIELLWEFIGAPLNEASHSIIGIFGLACFISIFFEDFFEPQKNNMSEYQINEDKYNNKLKLSKFHSFWQAKVSSPFFLLFLGGISHLFLDTFMYPWAGGINWLYPFDFAIFRWSFKLWWPGSYDAIILLAPVFIAVLILKWFIHSYKVRNLESKNN